MAASLHAEMLAPSVAPCAGEEQSAFAQLLQEEPSQLTVGIQCREASMLSGRGPPWGSHWKRTPGCTAGSRGTSRLLGAFKGLL